MTKDQANKVQIGDTVGYAGEQHIVLSIRVSGMTPPYFRLSGLDGDLVSFQLCSLPRAGNLEGGKRE